MRAAEIGVLCLDWLVCLPLVDVYTSGGFMDHLLQLCHTHTHTHRQLHVRHFGNS